MPKKTSKPAVGRPTDRMGLEPPKVSFPRTRPGPVGEIIRERQSTHGIFKENSVYMQEAKDLMRDQPNWLQMDAYQREALDMLQHKIGRILHGDPNFMEHWDDLAGYAQRVSKTIKGDLSP